jgi:hypothetical protein
MNERVEKVLRNRDSGERRGGKMGMRPYGPKPFCLRHANGPNASPI